VSANDVGVGLALPSDAVWDVSLGDATSIWAKLRAGAVSGRSRIAPVVEFEIYARTPRERMQCQIHLMRAQLLAGGERIGDGIVTGVDVRFTEHPFRLETPIGRAALEYLDSVAAGDHIQLTLLLSGWLRACNQNEDGPQFASEPPRGEWAFEAFGAARQTELHFEVARSDWFTRVLQPIGTTEYVSTEILLPHGDASLRQCVQRLKEADRAFSLGDDPTVFARCRAALDALSGAPKSVFAGLADPDEREKLDALLRAAGQYLHRGRHVRSEGTAQAGEFPVDHADARFALNLMKLLVAHVSKVLAR